MSPKDQPGWFGRIVLTLLTGVYLGACLLGGLTTIGIFLVGCPYLIWKSGEKLAGY